MISPNFELLVFRTHENDFNCNLQSAKKVMLEGSHFLMCNCFEKMLYAFLERNIVSDKSMSGL